MPRCPAGLGADGKRLWRQLSPYLNKVGVLTKLDGLSLTLLCQSFDDYCEARRTVGEEGTIA